MTRTMTVNRDIVEMEYAVRGPIPLRAAELAKEGRLTVLCNIGNPQALGQSPISYYRQALSLLEHPDRIARERLLNQHLNAHPGSIPGLDQTEAIDDEILDLCETMLEQTRTGTGAYTESKGFAFIREAVAAYINRRDEIAATGAPAANPDTIFLTNGASEGVKYVLEMLIAGNSDGIMIPIPQYPLYSAVIRKCGGVQVNYYPDEENGWALNREILEESIASAKEVGVQVKAIVVINPGNPTGAILAESDITAVIDFAREHGLAVIADEVYQENTYGKPFCSFAKALGSDAEVPLFSLHSTSKGFYGECGHRGGYLEVRNPPAVAETDKCFTDILLKQASVCLCSNTVGQLLTYLMVTPPQTGGRTFERYMREREQVLLTLEEKALMLRAAFERMNGVECFGETGAMYLFPRLGKLPEGRTDFDYCMALLEETGLCTVNGAGFGQKAGTHHLRIAFLPPKDLLEQVIDNWVKFHNIYVNV